MLKSKSETCLNILIGTTLCFLLISCIAPDATKARNYVDPVAFPHLVDRSWLEPISENCNVPCWRGLEPGKSSKPEALALAQTLVFVELGQEMNNAPGNFIFQCKMPPGDNCLSMTFKGDILSDLWLYPNYLITFEQVVADLGDPDGFSYIRPNPEGMGCIVEAYWIKIHLIISYRDPNSLFGSDSCTRINENSGRFPNAKPVNIVRYATQERIDEIIALVQKPGTGAVYVEWIGFDD